MTLDVHRFVQFRPYLYHLTARENLSAIEQLRELRCTNLLLEASGLEHLASTRRREHLQITIMGSAVIIRDQAPLKEGAIEFEDGWSVPRLVKHLNEQVFFWPGTAAGPIGAGANHFDRYSSERPVIIRIGTQAAIRANLRYSRFNSGAPRCSGGKRSPRGSKTYFAAEDFPGTPSDVVEVVVEGSLQLPATAELAEQPYGPWRRLIGAT